MTGMVGFTEIEDPNERPKTWRDIEDPGDGAPAFLDEAGRRRAIDEQLRRAVRWHLADLFFKGPATNRELIEIARLVIIAERSGDPVWAVHYLDAESANQSEAIKVAVARISDSFELAAHALSRVR